MFGGLNNKALNKLEIFDPINKAYKSINQTALGRYGHSMIAFKNKIIVYGG